jgi:hypothetical protein
MTIINETFPEYSASAVSSYNYTDLAEGTGTVLYYAIIAENSSGKTYKLLSHKSFSETELISSTNSPTTFNFDTSSFNFPRTVKGTAFFSCSAVAASGDTGTVKVQIKKYDGTTETNLSSEITSQTINDTVQSIFLELPLTETNIKKGEILRVSVIVNVAINNTLYVGCDSMERDTIGKNFEPCTMTLFMPYKINL